MLRFCSRRAIALTTCSSPGIFLTPLIRHVEIIQAIAGCHGGKKPKNLLRSPVTKSSRQPRNSTVTLPRPSLASAPAPASPVPSVADARKETFVIACAIEMYRRATETLAAQTTTAALLNSPSAIGTTTVPVATVDPTIHAMLVDLFGGDTATINEVTGYIHAPELTTYIDGLIQWIDQPTYVGPRYPLDPLATQTSRPIIPPAATATTVAAANPDVVLSLKSKKSADEFLKAVKARLPSGMTIDSATFGQANDNFLDLKAKSRTPPKEVEVLLWETSWVRDKKFSVPRAPTVSEVTRAIVEALANRSALRPDPTDVGRYGGYRGFANDRVGELPPRDVQPDKRAIIVIHGETGIGKTAYATHGPDVVRQNDSAVYHLINDESDKADLDAIETAEKIETTKLTTALMHVFAQIYRIAKYDEPAAALARKRLQVLAGATFPVRNGFATSFVVKRVKQQMDQSNPEWESWRASAERVPSLVVIVDEIGKCLALARGIAAAQTEIYKELGSHAHLVTVALVGTGADALAFGGDHRPSTDPSKVSLIQVKAPTQDSGMLFLHSIIRSVSSGGASVELRLAALKACEDGVLKWMVTNPRLVIALGKRLDDSIPPYRVLPVLIIDSMEEFATLTGIWGLHPHQRQQLLIEAYIHLMQPVKRASTLTAAAACPTVGFLPLPGSNVSECEKCVRFGILERERDSNRKHIEGKYLASEAMQLLIVSDFGRQLRISDGYGFETLIKVMLCRHWTALGYNVQQLKPAYPFPGSEAGESAFGMTASDFEAIVMGLAGGGSVKQAVVIENGLDAPGADYIVMCRSYDATTTATLLECFFFSSNKNNKMKGKTYPSKFQTLGLSESIVVNTSGMWSQCAWAARVNAATTTISACSSSTATSTQTSTMKQVSLGSSSVVNGPSQRAANALQHLLHCVHTIAVSSSTTATGTVARSEDVTPRAVMKTLSTNPTFLKMNAAFDAPPPPTENGTVKVSASFYLLESKMDAPTWQSFGGTTAAGAAFGVIVGEADLPLWKACIGHGIPQKVFFAPQQEEKTLQGWSKPDARSSGV